MSAAPRTIPLTSSEPIELPIVEHDPVSSHPADVLAPKYILDIQKAALEIQQTALRAEERCVSEPSVENRQLLVAVQESASKLLKAALKIEENVLFDAATGLVEDEAMAAFHQGSVLFSQGRIEESTGYLRRAVELNPYLFLAQKSLGDANLSMGLLDDAVACYQKALAAAPEFPEADNNLSIALLGQSRYGEARSILHRMLSRDRGLPEYKRFRFEPSFYYDGRPHPPATASPNKILDIIDQLNYLIANRKIDSSFQELVVRYERLLKELFADRSRAPYAPMSQSQLEALGGYHDRVLYYSETKNLEGPTLNPSLDFDGIQHEYARTGSLYFDDLLTQEALFELRRFFLESTIFFKYSEAGFVGSYVNDGFNCQLIFQIVAELRSKFARILKDKHLNNMWCYRYAPHGSGVRPHNGDGSVTFNFYLTLDEANMDPGGGGMIMYDKDHPKEWDWLKFNTYKDDPEIQAQIEIYLRGSESYRIPYKCNRAVLFRSTLFHSTDPFHFHEGYENRRMNITMLFGKRGQESLSLK